MVEDSRPARASSSRPSPASSPSAPPARSGSSGAADDGQGSPARAIPFDALWESYRRLKAGPGGPAGLLGRIDPAVFLLRRRILSDCLKGLLLKSPRIRALTMEHKKLLARHLSSTVWKGYLLALAYQDELADVRTGRSMLDQRYLSGVFFGLMKGADELACLESLDPCVSQGLARIQAHDADKLSDQLAAAGARSVVAPEGERRLLFAALGGLALMGFMIWKAQIKALGAES
jgi:hypothetical protein